MFRSVSSFALALAAVVCFAAFDASAEFYRYTDADGHRHAVSDLQQVPAGYREAAVADARSRSGGSVNVVGSEAAAKVPPANRAAATPAAMPSEGEDWWRTQAQEKRRAVEDARTALEAAEQAEEDDITSDTLEPVRVAGRGGHSGRPGRGRNHYYDDDDDEEPSVAELQTGLDRAERDLADFEERARGNGVPPGWLR